MTDGMAPQEFLRIGREQLQPYDVTLGAKAAFGAGPPLGIKTSNEHGVQAEDTTATDIDGLFVAGDATRDVQQFSVAAAGCKAAFEINTALYDEDYK